MSLELYAAYLVACLIIVIVPGPTVTLIVANSLRHGTRAGILNVLGTQVGEAIIITAAGIGLASLIEAMGHWFDWLRVAGAAYLIWLGWKMIRSSGEIVDGAPPQAPRGGFVAQGCLVALSNPKTLLFFGAFFSPIHRSQPRSCHADRDHGHQRHGDLSDLRQRLCARLRPRWPRALRQAREAAVARERRLPDRRRCVARRLAALT